MLSQSFKAISEKLLNTASLFLFYYIYPIKATGKSYFN
uniref:Uncharacterized protein n=1 Tax=Myoviridae sp. ctsip2 TaxID=2826705 RepID=A0A8S5N5A0_9CAUD|nr:MAG TPA: hypothetical protein [Myoviridae sp. ctsip2]